MIGTMVSLGNSYQSQLMLAVQIIPFILAGKTGPRPYFLVVAVMFLRDTTGPFSLLWSVTLSYSKTGDKNVQLVLQRCCKTSRKAMLLVLPSTFKPVLQQIRFSDSGCCNVRENRPLIRWKNAAVTSLLQNKFVLSQ